MGNCKNLPHTKGVKRKNQVQPFHRNKSGWTLDNYRRKVLRKGVKSWIFSPGLSIWYKDIFENGTNLQSRNMFIVHAVLIVLSLQFAHCALTAHSLNSLSSWMNICHNYISPSSHLNVLITFPIKIYDSFID